VFGGRDEGGDGGQGTIFWEEILTGRPRDVPHGVGLVIISFCLLLRREGGGASRCSRVVRSDERSATGPSPPAWACDGDWEERAGRWLQSRGGRGRGRWGRGRRGETLLGDLFGDANHARGNVRDIFERRVGSRRGVLERGMESSRGRGGKAMMVGSLLLKSSSSGSGGEVWRIYWAPVRRETSRCPSPRGGRSRGWGWGKVMSVGRVVELVVLSLEMVTVTRPPTDPSAHWPMRGMWRCSVVAAVMVMMVLRRGGVLRSAVVRRDIFLHSSSSGSSSEVMRVLVTVQQRSLLLCLPNLLELLLLGPQEE
jgi:hypothetical protein